jgi:hypothetical protein
MFSRENAEKLAREFRRKTLAQQHAPDEQSRRAGSACGAWSQVYEAFERNVLLLNEAAGEEILVWESANDESFTLARNGVGGRLKGAFHEGAEEIQFVLLERPIRFNVESDLARPGYRLVGPSGLEYKPDDLAGQLIADLLRD